MTGLPMKHTHSHRFSEDLTCRWCGRTFWQQQKSPQRCTGEPETAMPREPEISHYERRRRQLEVSRDG